MDNLAQLTPALAGRYTMEREIGRGGMATVYLARDVRHDRWVAVKVLNPELGAILGVERFLAEIKVTANLQHPNLLPLFDSGEAAGQLFYVMPFVEGESLRARLEREKQLPIAEAIGIAVAVANALQYAHGHGVIHRDLKPENILLQAEQPVVADFGIALAVSKAGGARVTQTGLSLGTPQYMSPEQATGDRVIDGRSDIYSLAAVTYEMLAGEPPHTGTTAQAIVARLLSERPRLVRIIRPTVPEPVEAALDQALEKLPADRFHSAREFADALSGKTVVTSTRSSIRTSIRRRAVGLTLAPWIVAVAAIGLAIWSWGFRSPVPDQIPIRFGVGLAPGQRLGWPLFGTTATVAISPDGRLLGYSVADSNGDHLEVRSLTELRGRAIPGATRSLFPEFSPDGKWVAYVSLDYQLRKVAVDGGAPVTLSRIPPPAGLTWLSNDALVYSTRTTVDRGMWRVPATGGEPALLTRLDSANKEVAQWSPRAVAGGKYVLYTSITGSVTDGHVGVASAETGESHVVLSLSATAVLGYVDGHVIYARNDGTVMAAPLDLERAAAGAPVPLTDSVNVALNFAAAALASSGTFTYVRGGGSTGAVLVGDHGVSRPLLESDRPYLNPRLSLDGGRLALTAATTAATEIWIHDFRSGTLERVPTEGSSDRAEWTPDGKRLVYLSNRNGKGYAIWWQPADASEPAELLYAGESIIRELSTTPNGEGVVFRMDSPTQARDIYYLPFKDRKPVPLVTSPADEMMPRISPDNHWLAYISDESGNYEVYVRPFPGPGGRLLVSTGGGSEPVWAPDGHRLFYRSSSKLMAASVTTSPSFTVTGREMMFDGPYAGHPYHQNYDVMPDGKTFVMLRPGNDAQQLVVVLNWLAEARSRIAGPR